MVRRSCIVPDSSIMASICSASASAIASNIAVILSSISYRYEKAERSTSPIVIPGSSTVCWSRYPTLIFFAHSTLPSSGISFPVTIFINVDLPSPLAPISPICSPLRSLKETLLKMALSPKPWLRFSTLSIIVKSSIPEHVYMQ